MGNPWDAFPAGSPEWWLMRLDAALKARQPRLQRYERYYTGDHPLLFASEKFRKAFGGLFTDFADNWCDIVVDAVEERLNIEGFRFGDATKGDDAAWAIWQDNHLDADSQIAHTEALIHEQSYALVWWGQDGQPEITVEHPMQTIVANAAGSRRKRAAALKKWLDDSGYLFATLYLPNAIYKFRSDQTIRSADYTMWSTYRWVQREVDGEVWPLVNKLEVVPVVPLQNRPRLLAGCESELRKVIPMQDAINKELADMLVASEFTAFRQRWLTGMEIPRNPETKEPIEPFKAAVDRLWMAEDPNAHFGEFSETSLGNYVQVIEMLVQHVASQTRTPPHYFYLSGQFPSGESIKAAETGLVAKAKRKMRSFGEGWEEVMRLAFRILEDKAHADATQLETIWGDPESRSEAERADALVKRQAIGVPQEQLWRDAGYSETTIKSFKAMRAEEPTPPMTVVIPKQLVP